MIVVPYTNKRSLDADLKHHFHLISDAIKWVQEDCLKSEVTQDCLYYKFHIFNNDKEEDFYVRTHRNGDSVSWSIDWEC